MTTFSSPTEHATTESPIAPVVLTCEVGIFSVSGGTIAQNFESLLGFSEGAVAEYATTETPPAIINSYSLVAECGVLSISGQAIATQIVSPLETGVLSLAGQAANISITNDSGSYVISGQSALFSLQNLMSPGSYAIYGGAAQIAMPVANGSYSIDGQSIFGTPGVIAGVGTLSITGGAVAFGFGFLFDSSEGAVAEYATTEFPRYNRFALIAESGAYAITGQSSVLRLSIPAETGVLTLTGGAANIAQPVAQGSYSISGPPLVLTPALLAGTGTYDVSGGAANIAQPVAHGSYDVSGQQVAGVATIMVNTGTYVVSGVDLGFLTLLAGQYAVTGQSSAMSLNLNGGAGSYSISGQDVRLPINFNMPVDAGVYSIAGQDAGRVWTFRPGTGQYSISGSASMRVTAVFGHGALSITGQEVRYSRTILAETGDYRLVGWSITDAKGPTGDFIFLVDLEAHDGSSLQSFYVGSEDWRSLPTDSPSNQLWISRLQDPGNFERSLFSKGEIRGRSSVGHGTISVLSGDPGNGELIDSWLSMGWNGRRIRIRAQPMEESSISAASTLLLGTTERIESTLPLGRFDIVVRDRLSDLDKPLLTERYAGTTTSSGPTAEGNEDLAGQVKQRVFGSVKKIPLQFANVHDGIYLASNSACVSIAVYDGGLPLTNAGDYASLALLQAATTGAIGSGAAIEAGEYATCLASGLIRVGARPESVLSADVLEGSTSADRTAAQIVRRMLLLAGIDSSRIVTGSFSELDTANSAVCGYLVSDDKTTLTASQDVLDSVGGWLVPNQDESFVVGRLEEPEPAPGLTFDLEQLSGSLDRIDGPVPVWRVVLEYAPVWRKHSESEILADVSEENKLTLMQEFRTVTSEDTSVKVKHLDAREITIRTYIEDPTEAQSEADRRLDLEKVEREQYNVQLKLADAWAAEPGLGVTLVHERLEMSGGKPFNVIGRIDTWIKKQVTLRVWG